MIELNIDITDVKGGVIAHGCNCSGGFGSGVAKSIKDRFPMAERVFRATPACPELLGQYQVVRVSEGLFVANVFTQLKYGYDGERYADPKAIREGLTHLMKNFCYQNALDLYVPRIGCGLGGLDWETEVKPIMQDISNLAHFADLKVYVCTI